MRLPFKIWTTILGLVLVQQVGAQSLALQQVVNLSRCTGDTLTIPMTVAAPGYGLTNDFIVQMVPGNKSTANFTTPMILPIVGWLPTTTGTIMDTISAGIKLVKVIVPKSIAVNNFYSVRVRSTSPITFSDTIDLTVIVSPVGSITSIIGGFSNKHTGNPKDWGMCENDTITLTANTGMATYEWLESGSPVTGGNQQALKVFASGMYSVKVSNGGCFHTTKDTIVNVFTPSTVTSFIAVPSLVPRDKDATLDSLAFCETDTLTLRGPVAGMPGVTVSYQWIRDSIGLFGQSFPRALAGATGVQYQTAESGAYRLVTSWNPGGCPDTSAYIHLFADSIPDTYIVNIPWPGQGTPSLNICPDDSTLLATAHTSPGGYWKYQWQVRYPVTGNWQNIPTDTTSQLTVNKFIVAGTAQYRVAIEGEACSFITAPVQVNVIPYPVIQTVPADSTFICFGDSVNLAVIGNALQYSWNNGSIVATSFFTKGAGTFVAEGIGLNGCASYDTVKVILYTIVANAGPDQVVLPGSTVQLNATGGTIYYWYADKPVYFSDPYNPNAQTHPTSDTTYYYVDVMSAEGCFDRDTMMVVQFDPTSLLPNKTNVQNLITPNGDNKNDVLDLSEVIQADGCSIAIMNRWGATVYVLDLYKNQWNGTNTAGDQLPDGTYYYVLNCGTEVRYRGAVTLVRNN